jgi:predicted RNA-binding protein with TRAM domain
MFNSKAIDSATSKYESLIKENLLISPVSKSEFAIIKELKEIFRKLEVTDVVAILDGYKYYSDQELEERLLAWNTNFIPKQIEKGRRVEDADDNPKSSKWARKFVEICDEKIEVKEIKRWKRGEKYIPGQGYVYTIIINETQEGDKVQMLYTNTEFTFANYEERELVADKFEIDLLSSGNIEII